VCDAVTVIVLIVAAEVPVMRRRRTRRRGVFEVGDLRVDLGRRQVCKSGREIVLTSTLYRLLAVLVQNAGCVVSQEELLRAVWGPQRATRRNLRANVLALRGRLGDDPRRPRYIVSERGGGYGLAAE